MKNSEFQILLSNDDGIDSPGLWAAAEALDELGYVTVAAPRDHMSATGRGFQKNSDGTIITKKLSVNDKEWDVYAVGGSPSQSVAHGILEIVPRKPDLVVTGINFGENFGTDVTYSGTVGAAIEAASLGIPGLRCHSRFYLRAGINIMTRSISLLLHISQKFSLNLCSIRRCLRMCMFLMSLCLRVPLLTRPGR